MQAAQENVTYVFCDVNGLHETNNKFGHEAGDRMLIALASELAKSFGQDMSFRFGGDEFLAIALDERLDKVQAKRYFLTWKSNATTFQSGSSRQRPTT